MSFRRAGLTVLIGSAGGHGVALLLTPVISRLFDPVVFGAFATLTAVASIFIGVSTMRLEVRSQTVASESGAGAMRLLALVSAVVWGLVLSVAAAAAVMFLDVGVHWLALGVMVVVASFQLVGTASLARDRRYHSLGARNFAQGAGTGVLQAALGSFGGSVWALVVGFVAARMVWLGGLSPKARYGSLGETWRDSRSFAAAAGSSAAVNSLAGQLPVLMTFWLYGSAQVGLLAMAMRLLVSPLGIVGQSAAQASVGEVGRLLRDGRWQASREVVGSGMRDLFLMALVPCLAAAALGAVGVAWLLGEEWRGAGPLLAVLSLGTLAQATVAPFSQLLNLTGRSRVLVVWDAIRFVAVALSFGLPAVLDAGYLVAMAGYSATLLLLYGALARLVYRSLGRPQP